MFSMARMALLALSSIPTAKPFGNHCPTSSAINFEGDAIPKKSLMSSVIPLTKPPILSPIQSATEEIPFHKPLTIFTPISNKSMPVTVSITISTISLTAEPKSPYMSIKPSTKLSTISTPALMIPGRLSTMI